MLSVFFRTHKTLKDKGAILAAFQQRSFSALMREALMTYADTIINDLRSKDACAELGREEAEVLKLACDKTGLTKSKILHLCLEKYVKDNLDALTNKISEKLAA